MWKVIACVMGDDGFDRHLMFNRSESMPIHIVTWKGYLTITGPKGGWVFWKVADCSGSFGCVRTI
jgi:hypothetical protein